MLKHEEPEEQKPITVNPSAQTQVPASVQESQVVTVSVAEVTEGFRDNLRAGLQQMAKKASLLEAIEQQIAKAQTAEERKSLLTDRQTIIEQNNLIAAEKRQHFTDLLELGRKTVLSLVGFGKGVYLTTHGFEAPGFLTLGASLFSIAPEFVTKWLEKWGGTGNEKK